MIDCGWVSQHLTYMFQFPRAADGGEGVGAMGEMVTTVTSLRRWFRNHAKVSNRVLKCDITSHKPPTPSLSVLLSFEWSTQTTSLCHRSIHRQKPVHDIDTRPLKTMSKARNQQCFPISEFIGSWKICYMGAQGEKIFWKHIMFEATEIPNFPRYFGTFTFKFCQI
jgi:hypothetical protein